MQIILTECRLLQNYSMRSGEVLSHGIQCFDCVATVAAGRDVHTEARHDADPLWLDEDLSLRILLGTQHMAKVIIGAAEPIAVPARLPHRSFHVLSEIEIIVG